ncbi:hypothetical protein AWC38_SpisGene13005 [Stylophora pistillata]|uniref:Uncharacterized protein n=1 Tax=Stylophora pistillata TaxID=50429 RepID=A0A2B4S1W8_STYPI|nr:hypothetical protein AWC38_SpisGene13005 [Stylophora pistillata]
MSNQWHSVHTNNVALRGEAQRNVEWYSVHTNGVALWEMAQHNAKRRTVQSLWFLAKACNARKPAFSSRKFMWRIFSSNDHSPRIDWFPMWAPHPIVLAASDSIIMDGAAGRMGQGFAVRRIKTEKDENELLQDEDFDSDDQQLDKNALMMNMMFSLSRNIAALSEALKRIHGADDSEALPGNMMS